MLAACCGSGLHETIWQAFVERFQIPYVLEFYAAAAGNFSLFNVEGKVGSIGRVPPFAAHRFPAALVKMDPATREPVRDLHGRCLQTDCDEIGEALGEIGNDAAGLFGRFEGYAAIDETERSILRDVFKSGDVWLRTGDLMAVDSEGFYRLVDQTANH